MNHEACNQIDSIMHNKVVYFWKWRMLCVTNVQEIIDGKLLGSSDVIEEICRKISASRLDVKDTSEVARHSK